MERVVETDSKGRLTLGKQFANLRFIVHEQDGDLTLKRAIVLPERELWILKNQEASASVKSGIADAREGKLHRDTVDLD